MNSDIPRNEDIENIRLWLANFNRWTMISAALAALASTASLLCTTGRFFYEGRRARLDDMVNGDWVPEPEIRAQIVSFLKPFGGTRLNLLKADDSRLAFVHEFERIALDADWKLLSPSAENYHVDPPVEGLYIMYEEGSSDAPARAIQRMAERLHIPVRLSGGKPNGNPTNPPIVAVAVGSKRYIPIR